MNIITEVQILTNIQLSQAQKLILSKLMLPEKTPLTSYEQVTTGENMVANLDTLVQLGMVIVGNNAAEITQKGIDAAKNENLVDEMGTLTQDGEKYAYAKDIEDIKDIEPQGTDPVMTDNPEVEEPKPMGNTAKDSIASMGFESWSMITTAQNELSEQKFIDSQKIKPKKS